MRHVWAISETCDGCRLPWGGKILLGGMKKRFRDMQIVAHFTCQTWGPWIGSLSFYRETSSGRMVPGLHITSLHSELRFSYRAGFVGKATPGRLTGSPELGCPNLL